MTEDMALLLIVMVTAAVACVVIAEHFKQP